MREFDFCDFAAYVTPGAALLIGLAFVVPAFQNVIMQHAFSVGGFGVFLLAAYVAGHLTQALGNLLEKAWWAARGGWPTDWVRSGKHKLLAGMQKAALEGQIEMKLQLVGPVSMSELDRHNWFAITRQMCAAVAAAGRADRIRAFNGNYGLCRGVAASVVIVMAAALASGCLGCLPILLVVTAVALYRMQSMGCAYARELLVQFLQLD
ncbi:MAG: hypothetical protein ACYTFZ_00195 [Planctomycetota bacterium]|jgi:hypothetical protein